MSKLVKILQDAYPFGCQGDIVKLADEEIVKLEALTKRLKVGQLYEEVKTAVETEVDKLEGKPDAKPKA